MQTNKFFFAKINYFPTAEDFFFRLFFSIKNLFFEKDLDMKFYLFPLALFLSLSRGESHKTQRMNIFPRRKKKVFDYAADLLKFVEYFI